MSEIRQHPRLIVEGGSSIAPPYTLDLDEKGIPVASNTGEKPVVISDKVFASVDDLRAAIADKLSDGIPHLVPDDTGIPREQPVSLFDSTFEITDAPESEGDRDSADAPKSAPRTSGPTAMPPR